MTGYIYIYIYISPDVLINCCLNNVVARLSTAVLQTKKKCLNSNDKEIPSEN